MIQGKCPICGKSFEVASLDDLPSFPFCSERCRLVDLGRWIDGSYAIPGQPTPPGAGDGPVVEDEEDD
jgi:endogenous inhibitor of DNA gyrase (YacG/DUF329 family)